MTNLIIILSLIGFCMGSGPIVQLRSGKVQGFPMESHSGRKFTAFEGIPFAKPPVGKLRFADPEPAENWDGILMANMTYTCLSYSFVPVTLTVKNEEDCLYLYVYVPRDYINPNENLDVIVHIHGGGFSMGAPTFMAGPEYLMDKDVVYVSFNYRLAMLGFLSTEDDVVSGNMGLKDQTMALRWIKDNIKDFGGNPDSVTLTGVSAGGASVHFHYISPLSKGLFHRGFSQSGHVLAPWAISHNSHQKVQKLGSIFDCPTTTNQDLIDCLRSIDQFELVDAQKKMYLHMDSIPFPLFAPVIEKGKNKENFFISEHPYKILERGEVEDLPWVTSNAKEEGIFPTCLFVYLHMMEEIDEKWNDVAPEIMHYQHTTNDSDRSIINKKIREFYLQDKPLSYENTDPLVKMFTDRLFLIDTEKALRLHDKVTKSPVYYYLYEYIMDQTFFLYSSMKRGAAHGDDSRFYVKVMGSPEYLSENDEKMTRYFVDFIVDFARNNFPTFKNVTWTPIGSDQDNINYLDIVTPDDIKMKTMKHTGPVEFWNNLPFNENEHSLE